MKANMNKPRNVRTYHKRLAYYNLLIERCGIKAPRQWKSGMRYCSEHANETVRLTKKVEVCGIIEDLEFELTNVPSGRISTNQNQSLNVFKNIDVFYKNFITLARRPWVPRHGPSLAKLKFLLP